MIRTAKATETIARFLGGPRGWQAADWLTRRILKNHKASKVAFWTHDGQRYFECSLKSYC